MRKITAYLKNNKTPEALSNFMPCFREGIEKATETFKGIINSQPMDSIAICKALNESHWTTENFKLYRPLDDGFTLLATDPWGNESIIKITESEA